MKEMIAFAVLVVSVLCFGMTYQPEPAVVEKPVVVEKVIEKFRDAPEWSRIESKLSTIDELEETIRELEENLNEEEQ